jgi:hypothetical protein
MVNVEVAPHKYKDFYLLIKYFEKKLDNDKKYYIATEAIKLLINDRTIHGTKSNAILNIILSCEHDSIFDDVVDFTCDVYLENKICVFCDLDSLRVVFKIYTNVDASIRMKMLNCITYGAKNIELDDFLLCAMLETTLRDCVTDDEKIHIISCIVEISLTKQTKLKWNFIGDFKHILQTYNKGPVISIFSYCNQNDTDNNMDYMINALVNFCSNDQMFTKNEQLQNFQIIVNMTRMTKYKQTVISAYNEIVQQLPNYPSHSNHLNHSNHSNHHIHMSI